MRKYKLALLCFVILCVLALGMGFIFKGRYKTYDKAYLASNLTTDGAFINVIDGYFQNPRIYDASGILQHEVYKVEIVDKKIYGGSVVSVAKVNHVYAGAKSVGDTIEIKENVRLDMIGDAVVRSTDFLDPGFVDGDEYIMALKPSEYGKELYDLAYDNFSYLRLADNYVEAYVDMYSPLQPYDENGNTILYYLKPDIDTSMIAAFYGPDSNGDDIVDKINSDGKAMYEKFMELANN
ncbi:MAG: hypothetical protein MR210_02715 [Erysipelotrichaceae bacterium]|nr:hypothetical protein [Erysipelotrichaceae bacterium]MDY5252999.1 hypothetical protein [Erysipelotrichaceae bacterium]